jgi:Kef-type K+ transport system membrane component KefB
LEQETEVRRVERLKKAIAALGGVFIIIALIMGIMQHFGVYSFYGDESNKWYFYGGIGVIGLIGIILAVWATMKQETKKETPATT